MPTQYLFLLAAVMTVWAFFVLTEMWGDGPVLLSEKGKVGPRSFRRSGLIQLEEETMETYQKILVVSQSTQECQKALRYGITLAKKFDAELCVLQTFYDTFGLRRWNLPIPSQMIEEAFQKMQRDTKKEIERMVEEAREDDLKVQVLLREGKFMDEVSRVVDEEKVDLMVLAAHSEWRLEHFLFGRNNEDILRKLPCSVMFVKDNPSPVT
jgi:nucleotide-binding universal stress UspA family protein